MASSKKPVPEKKAKDAKKKSSKEPKKKTIKGESGSAKRKNDKNKITNGTVNDNDEVPATPSSSSDSQPDVEITQKTKSNNKKRKQESEDKEESKMNKFPMERIRRIIRSEDSDMRISNEAVFLVNKATEKFLEKFCGEAYATAVKDRKKSLGYKHLSSVVSERKRYDFLSDFVPEKVKAEDALAERKLVEPEAA